MHVTDLLPQVEVGEKPAIEALKKLGEGAEEELLSFLVDPSDRHRAELAAHALVLCANSRVLEALLGILEYPEIEGWIIEITLDTMDKIQRRPTLATAA